MIERLRGHTIKCIAQHQDLFLDLVILRDLAHAAARPHQRDGSVLRIGEALVDTLLNVEQREVVDPAM
jgi:hypothetical protein